MLEFAVFLIGAYFQTVCIGDVLRYFSARMRYESDSIGMIGPLGLCFRIFALSAGIFRIM